jgi:hypothetical protein
VMGFNTANPGSIVGDFFYRSYVLIVEDMSFKVYERHSSEDGTGAFEAYTDHFTINGNKLS